MTINFSGGFIRVAAEQEAVAHCSRLLPVALISGQISTWLGRNGGTDAVSEESKYRHALPGNRKLLLYLSPAVRLHSCSCAGVQRFEDW